MRSDVAHLQTLVVVNLRDHIKRQVCDAILNGMFRPGERLVEAAIADQLGVSRAPVREALVGLEREGIVTSQPRRGYFVVDFTDKDIEEIYSLRRLLEGAAVGRAIDRMSPDDLDEVQRIVDNLGEAVQEGRDWSIIVSSDLGFHEALCRAADHSRLYTAWDSMRLQSWLLIGLTSRTHYDRPDEPKAWHQRILDAILDKDHARATAIMHDHLLDAEQRARRAWRALHASEKARAAR
jgi:DNA-binding GntR family transcriptional regulator